MYSKGLVTVSFRGISNEDFWFSVCARLINVSLAFLIKVPIQNKIQSLPFTASSSSSLHRKIGDRFSYGFSQCFKECNEVVLETVITLYETLQSRCEATSGLVVPIGVFCDSPGTNQFGQYQKSGVFRTLSSIKEREAERERDLFAKIVIWKAVNYFCKKLHLRWWTRFWMRLRL